MKHIFTIHSPITFLSSILVIQRENLKVEDVILLTSGYNVPNNEYQVVESPGHKNQSFLAKLSNLNFPKYFDREMSIITDGDNFTAYIDLMSYHQRILVTHQNCIQFHFIEEGSLTYLDHDNLRSIAHLDLNGGWRIQGKKNYIDSIFWYLSKAIRGYSKRLLFMPFNYRGYAFFSNIKFFCFSSLAYPGLDNSKKIVLEFKMDEKMLNSMSCSVDVSETIVWIDDSLIRAYPRYKDTYKAALIRTIAIVKKKYPNRKHAIKLRPKWEKEQSFTYSILAQYFDDIQIFHKEVVMEAVLLTSKSFLIIGNVSIVLFYATLMGHKVFSLFPLLEDTDDLLFKNNISAIWTNIKPVTALGE